MSVAKYSYINAKLRALKADLLTSEQWDALLGARDMHAALRILEGSGYSSLVKDFDVSISSSTVERVLQEDFTRVLVEIINEAPEPTQELVKWIARKFQKEIVKTLLRLQAAQADQATANRLLVPIAPFTGDKLRELTEAADIRGLTSQIPDSFFRRVLEETLPRYEETGEVLILEQAVDAMVLRSIFEHTERLAVPDREATLPLVGLEIDLINLMITLRSHSLRIPPEEAEKLLIEVEHRLPLTLCRRAMQAKTLEEVVRVLNEGLYSKQITKGWEAYEQHGSLHAFEHVFHQHLRQASIDVMLGYPFHFGIILGYLNLKWYETLNLKAVMHGKAEDLDPHLIRRTIIL
ncbi:MAG: V-type ATPase subunit [Promethearchaeota archaeon]